MYIYIYINFACLNMKISNQKSEIVQKDIF